MQMGVLLPQSLNKLKIFPNGCLVSDHCLWSRRCDKSKSKNDIHRVLMLLLLGFLFNIVQKFVQILNVIVMQMP